MSDNISETTADFGLGLFDRITAWLRWRFGPPQLDLVFEGDKDPYLMNDGLFDPRTNAPIKGRWYRVGVVNRSRSSIQDVEVTAEHLEPSKLPGLPKTLHWMDDNPPRGTAFQATSSVPADRRPSRYADVVSHRSATSSFELRHITPGVSQTFPAERYELILQVRGEGTKSRRRSFILDLDESGELRFRPRP